jgi:CIC family chloride channel protein
MTVEELLPGQTAHSGAYALVGMGAVLAGATHAPITAILMLFELTSNYTIILPLMLSCIISVVLAGRLYPTSIFTTRLRSQGVRLRSSSEADMMRNTKVRRLLRPFPETMAPNTPLKEVLRRVLDGTTGHKYVVNSEEQPIGVITLPRLRAVFTEHDLNEQLVVAADLMRSPVTTLNLDDTLDVAMFHLSRLDTEMLPVVDKRGVLTGTVTRHDIMVFFEHEILKDPELGLKFVPEGKPDEARFIEVPEGHVIRSIRVSRFLNGQTLRELDLRATVGVTVVGIRRPVRGGIRRLSPDPAEPLLEGDILIAVGDAKAVNSLANSMT